jgi:hypothetical protein
MRHRNWRVRHIEIEPDSGTVVTMAQGGLQVRLRAPDFGVGRRKEAAALARFAAKSGLGDVWELFRFFVAFPADFTGRLLLPLERRHA